MIEIILAAAMKKSRMQKMPYHLKHYPMEIIRIVGELEMAVVISDNGGTITTHA